MSRQKSKRNMHQFKVYQIKTKSMNLSQGKEGALSMSTKAPAGWTTRPIFLCKCELREHLPTFHHFVTAREPENPIPENNLPKPISSSTSHDETRLSMSRILKSPRSFFILAVSGDLPTPSTGLIDLVLPACSDAGSTSLNPDHGHGPMITQAPQLLCRTTKLTMQPEINKYCGGWDQLSCFI